MANKDLIITERSNIVAVANAIRSYTGETKHITFGEIIDGVDVVGSSSGIDTSDATASPNEILQGETAYVNGEKITGTIETKTSSNLTASGATVTVPAGYYTSQATKSVATATRAETTMSVTTDDTNDKLTITASNNQGTGYVTGANKTASKTISLTANGATITASDGTNSISKSVATATQATPSISVNSSGLITATATQTAGYVTAGTKSSTHQLAFQAAKTITPTTASQIAVSSGYYTGGNITVAAVPTQSKTVTPTSSTQNITPDSGKFLSQVTVNGDSDLVAGNIKSGVNIFGVTGTYVGSGGGDSSAEDGLVARTLTSYTNDRVTTVGNYAFYSYSNLTSVSFPKVTRIGSNAFSNCNKLTTVNFPAAITILSQVFRYCSNLTTVNFPALITIGSGAFSHCYKLTTVNFPAVATISDGAFFCCSKLTTASFPALTNFTNSMTFKSCYNLKSLYLMGSSVCKLSNSNAFSSTPIGGYSTSAGTYGSIYVPASLLASYKAATNWTYFSSRFVGI